MRKAALFSSSPADFDRDFSVQENMESSSKQREAEARLVSQTNQLTHQLEHASTEYNAQLQLMEKKFTAAQTTNTRLLEEVRAERKVCTLLPQLMLAGGI